MTGGFESSLPGLSDMAEEMNKERKKETGKQTKSVAGIMPGWYIT